MIDRKTVLAIIPARGGSKGIVRKNIREIAGKPLLAWSIEEAKKSKYIDRIVLTSEDEEIISVALNWGCEVPFIRPKELAMDDTPGMDPVIHAIKSLPDYDYIVLLQPTSPLRSIDDIDGCLELCIARNAKACVSVTEPDKSPYWMYLVNEGRMTPFMNQEERILRRQDFPEVVALNGAVYVAESEWLLLNKTFVTNETFAYTMPKTRSIDIDTEFDLQMAEFILSMNRNITNNN
jgi:CMP-N,N'-diacetyllegionaminic acid synthase